jgi:hypothetical protein
MIHQDHDDYDSDHACEDILWLWFQYGQHRVDEANHLLLDHSCMSAGEDATDFLDHYGYGSDQGWSCGLTRKGLDVLGEDERTGIDE